jgi:hypothetical protein
VNDHVIRQEPERRVDASKLVVGLLLVTFGLAFLFDRLYWFDAFELVRLWPLWLILFGVARILFPSRGRGRLAGFWPLLIGGIFLLDTQDILPLHDSWPLFIVGAGLLMTLRAMGVGGAAGCGRHGERAS